MGLNTFSQSLVGDFTLLSSLLVQSDLVKELADFGFQSAVLILYLSDVPFLISRLAVVLGVSVVQLLNQRFICPLQIIVCSQQITDFILEVPDLYLHLRHISSIFVRSIHFGCKAIPKFLILSLHLFDHVV